MPRRALTAIACLAALALLLPAGASATIAEVGAIQPTEPPTAPSCTAGPMGAVGLAMEREKTEEEEAKAREQKEKEKKEREKKARERKAHAKHKRKKRHGKKHRATGHKSSVAHGRRRARRAAISRRRRHRRALRRHQRALHRRERLASHRVAAAAQVAPSTTTTTTPTTAGEEESKSGEEPATSTGQEAGSAEEEEAPCLAVSRTTGLQMRVGSALEPLVIPQNGRIVAWTLQLGRPTPAQIKFFNANEGGQASAGISILQPKKHPKSTYKLIAQSQVLKVERFFGLTVQFPLARTIKVKKGDVVALTVPTWVPALALGFGKETSWLSSRQKGQCSVTNAQTAQMELKSLVQYSCSYQTARLTYSATLISTP